MTPAGFFDALRDAGLEMCKPDPVGDGVLHRYRVTGDKAGSLNGWYVLNLDGRPFAAFGSWKTGQSLTWVERAHDGVQDAMTAAERETLSRRMDEAKRARAACQASIHAAAAERAARLWRKSHPATSAHPYLVKKGVQAYGVRLLRDSLVIPLRDSAGVLHSLQFIRPSGEKRFLSGGRKHGCYYAIGRPIDAICICEGYATAASIYEATGCATACAFDAGNLEPVARALRGKYPRLDLILCADNDAQTQGNPGVRNAEKAARAVRGLLAVPSFDEVSQ